MQGLRRLMQERGERIAALAEDFGVDENTVWRWRAGRSLPGLDIQRRLCARYGCTFDALLGSPECGTDAA